MYCLRCEWFTAQQCSQTKQVWKGSASVCCTSRAWKMSCVNGAMKITDCVLMEHLCDLGIISLESILLSTAFYIVMHSGLLHNPITNNSCGFLCSAAMRANLFLKQNLALHVVFWKEKKKKTKWRRMCNDTQKEIVITIFYLCVKPVLRSRLCFLSAVKEFPFCAIN